ncbi:MAG: DUF547 domain-containing protein [Candidatus Nitronauta litoralis]|uniref:DUF547 domain-containing protein n=1 Tax=Candidatus Nitronauta litoralis TaxID=2705533 RepID=A0A7T0FZA3_9BACT|nr:MAG: DUF547 domain-containing protein [Candidatus Nitronauta litoralis]
MKSKTKIVGLSFLFTILLANHALAFDFSGWDALLKKHVKSTSIDGVKLNGVDYVEIKKDPGYIKLIAGLKVFSPKALKTRREKLAFWINTYNVMAVKMVLDHYPVESIKDAGGIFSSVWKKKVGQVGGKDVTLNEIEHEILRPMGEPRIHVAIVCASVSCPDLRPEAYKEDQLDGQLNDQMRQFLANSSKGLKVSGKDVYISKIFKWFEEDFEVKGGVSNFLYPYAPNSTRVALKNVSFDYLDYNWNLNKL